MRDRRNAFGVVAQEYADGVLRAFAFGDVVIDITFFFQNARHDSLVTEADALAYQAAGSEPKRIEWYDSGHGLPTRAYLDMVSWLAEQISIDDSKFQGPS